MKTIFFSLAWAVFWVCGLQAQVTEMTGERLVSLIVEFVSEDAEVGRNVVRFNYEGIPVMCFYNENQNRMRIISPIKKYEDVSRVEKDEMMRANFHGALDARYCESSGLLYAAYIHPLASLEEMDVVSAIFQVLSLNSSFGSEYSSGILTFGGAHQVIEGRFKMRS